MNLLRRFRSLTLIVIASGSALLAGNAPVGAQTRDGTRDPKHSPPGGRSRSDKGAQHPKRGTGVAPPLQRGSAATTHPRSNRHSTTKCIREHTEAHRPERTLKHTAAQPLPRTRIANQ
jgi:hypothetical protein